MEQKFLPDGKWNAAMNLVRLCSGAERIF